MNMLKTFVLITLLSTFTVGCGGGSNSGAGDAESGSNESSATDAGNSGGSAGGNDVFTDNVSGVWTGNASVGGATPEIVFTLTQAVSSSLPDESQTVTGTYTADGGSDFPVVGTKVGNAVTLSVTGTGLVLTFAQNLTSANAMSGTVTLSDGSETVVGTASMTR